MIQSSDRTVFICRDHVLESVLDEIAEGLSAKGIRVVRGPASAPGQILDFADARLNDLFGVVDVAVFSGRWRCTRAVLGAAPRLVGIVNPTIGLDTVDLEAADDNGIIVGHGAVPENYQSMAEATVMLMLALMYNLHGSEDVLRGRRPKPRPGAHEATSRMVKGSTIGLIGLGRIGRAVAERLQPFGARLIAYSPSLGAHNAPPGVTAVSLDDLLRSSDLVGLFVALDAGSRHMINEAAFSKMKDGAYLVNVARGDVIDEAALIRALQNNKLAGAALDTFSVEPLPADSPLRLLDNVILTPHMVGTTRESFAALAPAAIDNILRILDSELPRHCKNPHVADAWHRRVRQVRSMG